MGQGKHSSQPGRHGHDRSLPGAQATPRISVPPPQHSKVPPRLAGPSGLGLQPRPGPLLKFSAGASEFPGASRPLLVCASKTYPVLTFPIIYPLPVPGMATLSRAWQASAHASSWLSAVSTGHDPPLYWRRQVSRRRRPVPVVPVLNDGGVP
ncbi:hypothetical protein NDU88_003552 [Pleurodeles waltl]|uniref:Uncharacterized protein n=1 Tax=Pleurodeles waltl TaxID=8319 RepID=A0AAV7RIJ5_PLEWA|nr:hypothetical protein NDU88_003552 [Pleurodeles waltl]